MIYPVEHGYVLAGVAGNAPQIAANDLQSDAYREFDPVEAEQRRYADALAAQVASQAVKADIYVTERPYLHAAKWSVANGVTLCRPEDAVALISLYLRAQGEFLVASRYKFNRGLFYWVGTRELLPSAWRWFSACVQHSRSSADDDLMLLAGSLLQRVDRALESRDAVHVSLNQPQNNDVRDEALSHLDDVLILLMGAMDVAARVAHRALGLPATREYRAAWQDKKKGGWLDQVRDKNSALAAVVAAGTANEQTLTILRLLRNSVHGAALQGIAFVQGGQPQTSLVGLPSDDETALRAAMNALGGEPCWGMMPVLPGRSHIDPGIFVDRLCEAVIPLLNQLMKATPVESLPDVNLSAADLKPPEETTHEGTPFDPWIRQSIRLQLGL